jgi:fibronectin type 3 domain-containing protein
VEQRIDHYRVERYSGEQLDLTTTVTEAAYRDPAVAVPATYTYRVYAVDLDGQQSEAASIVVETGN